MVPPVDECLRAVAARTRSEPFGARLSPHSGAAGTDRDPRPRQAALEQNHQRLLARRSDASLDGRLKSCAWRARCRGRRAVAKAGRQRDRRRPAYESRPRIAGRRRRSRPSCARRASPVNLEYDLESGGRGDRDALIEEELCALTGAEAATVVNNNAAAVLLGAQFDCQGPRSDRIARRADRDWRLLPDSRVMERSGARLREVGTTNRTHPRDYAAAIGPDTACCSRCIRRTTAIIGFTAEVSLARNGRDRNALGLP